jgi:hypothetical protein
MDYKEILAQHWLFFLINILIFIAVVFMSWASVRISYARQTRELRAEFEAKEQKELQQMLLSLEAKAEQARQLLALVIHYKERNLPQLLSLNYNLLTHQAAQIYAPALEAYCGALLQQLPKLAPNVVQKHQLSFGRQLAHIEQLYRGINAPILLRLAAAAPQANDIYNQPNVKALRQRLQASTAA